MKLLYALIFCGVLLRRFMMFDTFTTRYFLLRLLVCVCDCGLVRGFFFVLHPCACLLEPKVSIHVKMVKLARYILQITCTLSARLPPPTRKDTGEDVR